MLAVRLKLMGSQ